MLPHKEDITHNTHEQNHTTGHWEPNCRQFNSYKGCWHGFWCRQAHVKYDELAMKLANQFFAHGSAGFLAPVDARAPPAQSSSAWSWGSRDHSNGWLPGAQAHTDNASVQSAQWRGSSVVMLAREREWRHASRGSYAGGWDAWCTWNGGAGDWQRDQQARSEDSTPASGGQSSSWEAWHDASAERQDEEPVQVA